MSANFKINFQNKYAKIIFNESPEAKTLTYGEYGKVGEVSEWVSALTHTFVNTYPIQDTGKFLHRSYAEALRSLNDDNVGYLSGTALQREIAEGIITRKEEVDLEVWYRVHSRYNAVKDANELWTEALKWSDPMKGEPRFVTHNRNALALLPYLQYMRRAEQTGTNIALLFSEKIVFLYESLKTNYALFLEGKIDAIKENMGKAVSIANFNSSVDQAEVRAEKLEKEGKPVAAPQMGTDAPAIGTRVTFFFIESGIDLENNFRDVTEGNLKGIVNAMKANGLGWKLATEAVAVKGRNIPEMIEE